MWHRRKTLIISAALLSIGLAGCTTSSTSASGDDDSQWTGASKEASELTFATNVKSMGFDWFKRMEIGIEQFGKDTGVTAFQQGPSTADPALQVQVAQDQVAQGIDALIVVPTEVASMEPVMKLAMDQGVVVVTHEASNVKNALWDVEAFDNTAYGEHLMQELAVRADETGSYAVFVGSLDSTAQNEWMDAAIAYQEQNFPEMKLVGDRQVTSSEQNTSYTQMKQLMQTYPDITGIIGGDSLDVVGAGQAVEEAGLNDQITVLGTSIVSYAGDLLKTGAIDLISTWDPADAGYAANQVALNVLQGKSIKEGTDLGVPGFESIMVDGKVITGSAWTDITADNMSDYDF